MMDYSEIKIEKIIASQCPGRYLVQVSEDEGRIIDLDQKMYFKPFYIASILARGYWEAYDAKPGEFEE